MKTQGDHDHCAFVHKSVGMRCGGYRKGHEERYVDHVFVEPLCRIEGCDKTRYSGGLCYDHFQESIKVSDLGY